MYSIQVLELEFPDDLEHTTTLNKLGKILENIEFTGRGVDFSLPVSLHRQVVERHPPEHARRTHALVSLANILNARFQQDRQIGDLEEAISCSREALSLTPLSNNYHSTILLCLANVLSKRYERSGQRADLDESITLFEEALSLLPPSKDYSKRPDVLNVLAFILISRYDVGGEMADMDRAIVLLKEALETTPTGNVMWLKNLAEAYRTRYP
jgi:tetratricopeptide (TPR) repeat protein